MKDASKSSEQKTEFSQSQCQSSSTKLEIPSRKEFRDKNLKFHPQLKTPKRCTGIFATFKRENAFVTEVKVGLTTVLFTEFHQD